MNDAWFIGAAILIVFFWGEPDLHQNLMTYLEVNGGMYE